MFERLSESDRLLLLKFVCAFAWADLEVTDKERNFVNRLIARLGLSDGESKQVAEWLDIAPSPGSVDPKRIPREHRALFVDTVRALVYADGNVDPDERANLDQLKKALESD